MFFGSFIVQDCPSGNYYSFVVTYPLGSATVTCKCFRSMKKNEAPHSLEVSIGLADKTLSGKCSCVAGVSRYCHHVIR